MRGGAGSKEIPQSSEEARRFRFGWSEKGTTVGLGSSLVPSVVELVVGVGVVVGVVEEMAALGQQIDGLVRPFGSCWTEILNIEVNRTVVGVTMVYR